MSDFQQQEQDLMNEITNALENHGYLPRIRAELKVESFKLAQEMSQKNQFSQPVDLAPKNLSDKNDQIMLELCRDLFQLCGLDKTKEMLQLEAAVPKQTINLQKELPKLSTQEYDNIPAYLLRLIAEYRANVK